MKRIFSMILAVMMVVVLGVLPAGADGEEGQEHEHFIRFTGEINEENTGYVLPDATVGEEYKYQIGVETCEHIDPDSIRFQLDSETMPAGLTVNESGLISGTPEIGTGDGPVTLIISVYTENTEDFVPGIEANFYLTVKPAEESEEITLRIPYTKIVEQGGTSHPGPQTFTLKIFDVGVSGAEITINGGTNIIETNGSGNYTDYMSVTGTRDALSEGFKVMEDNDGAANWTYSDMVWFIQPQEDDTFLIREENEEGSTRDSMLFINTYNYSPVRDDVDNDYDDDDDYDYDNDYDDDDDYDYDYDNDYDDDEDDDEDNSWFIRIPEKKVPLTEKPQVNELPQEETIPQENEVKDNPNTGLGSTWDYLVYLFHKCFFWTI